MHSTKKTKINSLRILQRNSKRFFNIWMVEYNKINVKSWDLQLNNLKYAAKNQVGVTFRVSIKMFDRNNLPHKLLLTIRQKTRSTLSNIFENNISTDIKFSKTQIFKII